MPVPLPKLLLAILGAATAWKSYQAFRARQRDSSLPPDPVTDRWWRRLTWGGAIVAADLLLILALHSTIEVPDWLIYLLFGVLGGGVLLAFTAAFMIGWRGAL